jgi:hypothetical protein
LKDWSPVVNDKNQLALRHLPSNREYVPTDHALRQMAVIGGGSTWMLEDLSKDKKHRTKDETVFTRDRRDAELSRDYLNLLLFQSDRLDQDKTRLFRTWNDGTLRAVLSEQYAIVNNEWYLQLLKRLIPNGLLSHWRGDADSIFGNILIPDSIRQEADSGYGGMLSIGNSEIGTRRLGSCPSVFRAICMNGCIWDQEEGVSVRRVHRGAIDLSGLALEIQSNLNKQIPLLNSGIDIMLGLRSYGCGDLPMVNIFAEMGRSYKLPKKQIAGVMNAFRTEQEILGKDASSAFGVLNAVTRYGQTLENDGWVKYDRIGGAMSKMDRPKWDKIRKRAASLDDKEIESLVGSVAHIL